jgi:hypothetical protein
METVFNPIQFALKIKVFHGIEHTGVKLFYWRDGMKETKEKGCQKGRKEMRKNETKKTANVLFYYSYLAEECSSLF